MSNEKNIYWQSVRGICILAVVLIHSLQCYDFNNGIVIIRQIINFAVAIFVFMAGYFVNIDKVSSKRFSAKRWIINRGGGAQNAGRSFFGRSYTACSPAL